jgi:hypothetical protein
MCSPTAVESRSLLAFATDGWQMCQYFPPQLKWKYIKYVKYAKYAKYNEFQILHVKQLLVHSHAQVLLELFRGTRQMKNLGLKNLP